MNNLNPHKGNSLALLDREQPEGYSTECLNSVKRPIAEESPEGKSVLIFRLQHEWLALPTISTKEVREYSSIHKLPHRSTKILLGITNVQGELKIVISLKALLNFKENDAEATSMSHRVYPRVVVFGKEKNDFVFPVDEVYGIAHLKAETFEAAPINVSKSIASFSLGIFDFKERRVGLLDDQRVLEHLNDHHL